MTSLPDVSKSFPQHVTSLCQCELEDPHFPFISMTLYFHSQEFICYGIVMFCQFIHEDTGVLAPSLPNHRFYQAATSDNIQNGSNMHMKFLDLHRLWLTCKIKISTADDVIFAKILNCIRCLKKLRQNFLLNKL